MKLEITASVGSEGRNLKTDTRRIQRALNQAYPDRPILVDGICGTETIASIERFQQRFMKVPDGRIDPGGLSLDRLDGLLSKLSSFDPVDAMLIEDSVGRGGRNLESDSRRIQRALNRLFPNDPIAEDGICGAATIARIERLQSLFMKNPDGRIDPGGLSFERLIFLAPDPSAKDSGTAIEITGSVGRGGRNLKTDTRRIQRALNEVYPATPLAVDGLVGAATIRRIERLQRRFMEKPDGRIDPAGRSIEWLNRLVPAMQGEWQGDSSKWPHNKKIDSLDRTLRVRVLRLLDRLEGEGFRPRVHYGWRSIAVQRELVLAGHSQVGFSYHNAQYENGRPRAYAVDIIDRRWGWSKDAEINGFWPALGLAGKDEGLFWGGDWRKFRDYAHLQALPNSMLAEIRRRSDPA